MHLEQFNKKEKLSIDPASTILITGSRRSGKTTYGKYLVSKISELYSFIILFTHTKSSHQWDDLVDKENIFEDYDPEVIESLFKRSNELKKECPDVNPYCLVIFDDVIDAKGIHNDEMIDRLFIRGRWANIGVIFITQYLNSVSPVVRTNSDIVVIPIQSTLKSLDAIYDSYGIIDKKSFFRLIHQYTENYMVFIIRNDKMSNDPKIKYQWDKR